MNRSVQKILSILRGILEGNVLIAHNACDETSSINLGGN
jgi:hypothetical protein